MWDRLSLYKTAKTTTNTTYSWIMKMLSFQVLRKDIAVLCILKRQNHIVSRFLWIFNSVHAFLVCMRIKQYYMDVFWTTRIRLLGNSKEFRRRFLWNALFEFFHIKMIITKHKKTSVAVKKTLLIIASSKRRTWQWHKGTCKSEM